MTDYKVGDEVRVFGTGHFRHERWTGHVIRTSRKYAWAEFEQTWTDSAGTEQRRQLEISFDMETGQQRGLNEFYVKTPEQVEREERKAAAIMALEAAGIEMTPWRKAHITLEEAEALAEVVNGWEN
jgi:hypothetical protein